MDAIQDRLSDQPFSHFEVQALLLDHSQTPGIFRPIFQRVFSHIVGWVPCLPSEDHVVSDPWYGAHQDRIFLKVYDASPSCPPPSCPALPSYKQNMRLQQTKMTQIQVHTAACHKCQEISEKAMAPQHEYDDRPSVQEVPRLCDDAGNDEESSKFLDEMDQTADIPTTQAVASAACRCDPSFCKCDPSTCTGVHHKTSPFRPGEIKELQRLLWYSYTLAAAIFILFFVALFSSSIRVERPALSEFQIKVTGILAGLRAMLGMLVGWLMGERLQRLMDGVHEIAEQGDEGVHPSLVDKQPDQRSSDRAEHRAQEQEQEADERGAEDPVVRSEQTERKDLGNGNCGCASLDIEAVAEGSRGERAPAAASCCHCCACPGFKENTGLKDLSDEERYIVSHPKWVTFLVMSCRLIFLMEMASLFMWWSAEYRL